MFQAQPELKKVIIIGNGFDLSLGLKTGYCDFLKSSQFQNLLSKDNKIADKLKKRYTVANWIDIENELKIISASLKKLVDIDLKPDYNLLCNALVEYLSTIDYSTINMNSNAVKFMEHIIRSECMILDYNYTEATKIVLKAIGISRHEISKSLYKVHGSVESSDIIFGVEDHAKIRKRNVFLKKSNHIHYSAYSLNKLMNSNRDLHIFGHSLGESDHSYFKPFFAERTKRTSTAKGTIYLHHYGPSGYDSLMSEIDMMTGNNLTAFRRNSPFEPIDSSK